MTKRLRTLEVVVGAVLGAATVRFFARRLAEFPENLWRLCLVPHFSATVVFCLTGLRVPDPGYLTFAAVIHFTMP